MPINSGKDRLIVVNSHNGLLRATRRNELLNPRKGNNLTHMMPKPDTRSWFHLYEIQEQAKSSKVMACDIVITWWLGGLWTRRGTRRASGVALIFCWWPRSRCGSSGLCGWWAMHKWVVTVCAFLLRYVRLFRKILVGGRKQSQGWGWRFAIHPAKAVHEATRSPLRGAGLWFPTLVPPLPLGQIPKDGGWI